jgi:hypothetical protein
MPAKPLEYIYPGIIAAQAIHVAVEFRIPDLLVSGPKSAAELASACGAHAPTLERLLRALTSIEIFHRGEDGLYRNSPLTEILRRDHPQSLWSETMLLPAPYMWKAVGELPEQVRTGEPAFDRIHGQNFFAYVKSRPEESEAFNRVMAQEILWTTPPLLKAYDFSQFGQLVDVGGGYGLFLSLVLSATPKLKGVLFDQAHVTPQAQRSFKGEVESRITILSGNFFDGVPEGGDAYLLRRIIHDWNDEDALKILGNVRRAMATEGTLLLIQRLTDAATNPAGLMDLVEMLLGGRERSEAEFRALVEAARFSLKRIVPAGTYCVIECKPA